MFREHYNYQLVPNVFLPMGASFIKVLLSNFFIESLIFLNVASESAVWHCHHCHVVKPHQICDPFCKNPEQISILYFEKYKF